MQEFRQSEVKLFIMNKHC